MNLCPFAKREVVNNRLALVVSEATSEQDLLEDLEAELLRVLQNQAIETSLLIHPLVLTHFFDYNQFLFLVDELLISMELDGVIQVASFHPDYQFGGSQVDDPDNYTNRSPYPMLHLIRESSLERAIDSHPDVAGIPQRNIELMQAMGSQKIKLLLQACFETSRHTD
ncbi:DUF1415 domain-containing protein [Alginatibacterium sediminis]|uniref:DUF1415 domain-containing protein n=2 Tax=Alginatibacterium sediminis TaxID=2164068 RepID=A0A420ENJ2_9ALTE|nr:DUF1415 domain-containing protein [Alginatibacterium sediminis]